MLIRLHGPFDRKIGKKWVEFTVEGKISVAELSQNLVKRFPQFKEYLTGDRTGDFLNSIFFVARQGALLQENDLICDEDELEIMAPVDGG
jgi:molybdopterin converting factor small subunit